MGLFLSLLLAAASAQEVSRGNGGPPMSDGLEADGNGAEHANSSRPVPLNSDQLDVGELTNDPGLARWFNGAIRIERNDRVLFSLESGTDASGAPLSQDSIFWLGSISKTFCSTAVLHLVDEGAIALDDPIGAHLPGWEPTDASIDGEVCTVERLLAHECGFPREPPIAEMGDLRDPLRNEETRTRFLEAARRVPLEFQPGADQMYSNLGYELAGLLVVAKGTGSYDDILQRRLFEPLGLERTGTEPGRVSEFFDRVAPMAVTLGSASVSSTQWLGLPADAPSRVGAAGNGFSTPRELTRFFEALANGTILKPETVAAMVRPRAINESYGLGIVLRDRDGSPEYGHNGALEPHGFNAHISTFPTWDTTVAVFVARGVTALDATSIAQRLIDAIMGKAYRSPFPEGVSDWLMANMVAAVFIAMPAWVLIGLLAMAVRPIRKPRLAWALRATNNAGALILIRGILGMHGDGFDRLIWPAVVAVPVSAMVWWRLQHDSAQPVVADYPSTARRIVGWVGLIFAVLIMPVIGWLVGVYAVHFVLLTAFAIGCAVKRAKLTP